MVQIVFGDSLKDGHSESLGNFTGIGTQEMETYYLIVLSFIDHHFCVTILAPVVVDVPLKRLVNTAPSNNVVLPKLFTSFFLTIPTSPILDGSKDSGRHIFVTHLTCCFSEQPLGE